MDVDQTFHMERAHYNLTEEQLQKQNSSHYNAIVWQRQEDAAEETRRYKEALYRREKFTEMIRSNTQVRVDVLRERLETHLGIRRVARPNMS